MTGLGDSEMCLGNKPDLLEKKPLGTELLLGKPHQNNHRNSAEPRLLETPGTKLVKVVNPRKGQGAVTKKGSRHHQTHK